MSKEMRGTMSAAAVLLHDSIQRFPAGSPLQV
jgi:hypothetical protein